MINEELDPRAILECLECREVTSITSLSGGSDTALWAVVSADKRYVLRVFQRGAHLDCEKERASMQAASSAGLPVPIVHAAGSWRDYPALLLSWMPGRTIG